MATKNIHPAHHKPLNLLIHLNHLNHRIFIHCFHCIQIKTKEKEKPR